MGPYHHSEFAGVLKIHLQTTQSSCLPLDNSQALQNLGEKLLNYYLRKILEELMMFTSSHNPISFTFNLIRNSLNRTSTEQSNKIP